MDPRGLRLQGLAIVLRVRIDQHEFHALFGVSIAQRFQRRQAVAHRRATEAVNVQYDRFSFGEPIQLMKTTVLIE